MNGVKSPIFFPVSPLLPTSPLALGSSHAPASPIAAVSPNANEIVHLQRASLSEVIETLRADVSAQALLDPNKSAAHHVGVAVREGRVSEALRDARAAAATLTASVRDEVIRRKEALLAEVDAVEALEKEVSSLSTGVKNLASVTTALSSSLAGQHEPMVKAVQTLDNVFQASSLLQSVIRFLYCTRRLTEANLLPAISSATKTSPQALPVAAEAVRELEIMLSWTDSWSSQNFVRNSVQTQRDRPQACRIESVDQVAKLLPSVRRACSELRRRAAAMLKTGMNTREQSSIAAAVVSFQILGVLKERVNQEVGRLLSETQAALQKCFEPTRNASSFSFAAPVVSNSVNRRDSGADDSAEKHVEIDMVDAKPHSLASAHSAESGLEQDYVPDAAQLAGSGSSSIVGGFNFLGKKIAGDAEAVSADDLGRHPSLDAWQRIDATLDAMFEACCKAILLQHVLSKKYDDETHLSLLHEPIASGFIDAIARAYEEQLSVVSRTFKHRTASGQTFRLMTADYPRLKSRILSLSSRVHAMARGGPCILASEELEKSSHLPLVPDLKFVRDAFLRAVRDVEQRYRFEMQERLTTSVSRAFEGGQAAGEAEANAILRILLSELAACRDDSDLFSFVVEHVVDSLKLYASNVEDYAAAMAPDRDSIRNDPKVVSFWHLAPVYNGLMVVCKTGSRVLVDDESEDDPHQNLVVHEIQNLRKLSDMLLDGPFSFCSDNIADTLGRMHTEDLAGDSASDDGCSLYALDVATQISMFADGVISVLNRSRALCDRTVSLAKRVAEMFLQHASLLHSLPGNTRQRIAADTAKIELALESLCPMRTLPKCGAALRAFRQMMFLDDCEFYSPSSQAVQIFTQLKPSLIALHVISRCCSDSLLHPHCRQDMTPSSFCEWMRVSSEETLWSAIDESLSKVQENENASSPINAFAGHVGEVKTLLDSLRTQKTDTTDDNHQ